MKGSNKLVLPQNTIGILGGGQLGKMMALSAKSMGYKIGILDPTPHSSASQVADFQIIAEYNDQKALNNLANKSNIITYEFENVDQNSIKKIKDKVLVPQKLNELSIISHRKREKDFLFNNNLPVVNYQYVNSESDLEAAISKIGFPSILKTCEGGYDGHDQIDINDEKDMNNALTKLNNREWILEEKVKFNKEVSIMVARNNQDQIETFPLSENIHKNHILHTSIVPARVNNLVHEKAKSIAVKIAQKLDLTGVLGIEFFLLPNNELIVNEMAPRPHNSGHYTIEACNISQFEAHIRCICGLSIPKIKMDHKAVMVNLLGSNIEVARKSLNNHPDWHLHDYGKADIRNGRKMGHITVIGDSIDDLLNKVEQFK
ncbi:5-(carboxyamino)imidazole ribonucleotide synthase [Apilactobacillus timberlakei]|uniref:5-(carboxyamino)imidazole ribonucleotide synthase n=1 Tax=Apilactobacillus timberlakei TaxID=2008380 RepID=UPI0011291524|nr:5-(carboxyamino)imidazole ribonucleotide synthase [Apilactobacillus timberlakei]TPR20117.1 5-(carboxyamino)imidazole ribonucleotide synthase [Apilactobacillus timberlakei]TPR21835.1 5-(carboxyamino)imidazole ribonucleotide synthase [Apilactobacillus timberlakei]TPR23080.1 5-(carboxyamino)imidazole ribonucleotide synthase [Apilactobacillus timberlakei]TPR24018.1 5-(carboxyamino)imidazole ribonucleotide synthase [Apilactobacillus timberlakei]